MDDLDCQLKRLIEQAKQYPPNSRKRIITVTHLLNVIERSGALYEKKNRHPLDVYHDAMQELRRYIFGLVERYDPFGGKLMTLLNEKFDYLLMDAYNKYKKQQPLDVSSLSEVVSGRDRGAERTLEDMISDEENPYLSDLVRQIIDEDSEGIFQGKCIRGKPYINFRAIALRKFDGETIREMANTWNIPEQTLYSFFTRSCKYFKPTIERYLKEG